MLKHYTIPGSRTITNNKENQDNITVYENEKIILACVSDGCTNAEYPVEAAKMNGQVAIEASRNIWGMNEKKAKQYLCKCYNEFFSNSDQLCATTAFVMINKLTKSYRVFSVGDTAVLSYNKNGMFNSFFKPINVFRKSATYFTNDELSVKRFSQFSQGTLNDDIVGFVIYSDGAEMIAHSPYTDIKRLVSSAYVSDEIFNEEKTNLFNKLQEYDEDDISIAIISIDDDAVANNMKKYYSELKNLNVENPAEIHQTSQNIDVPVVKTQQKAMKISKEQQDENNFIDFLSVPHSLTEIVTFNIIAEEKITMTIIKLMKQGVISCTEDGKFFKC